MSLSKYHTIGSKLLLAFGCSTLLVTLVSLVSWFTWSRLDDQVTEVLDQSVPKYNASYVLETRSSEIRRRIQQIGNASNKVMLGEQIEKLNQDLMIMDNVLNALETNSVQVNLHTGYLKLKNMSGQYGSLVSQRIDVTRQIDLLGEQLQWLYQDMEMELVPLRQEMQWQLERKNNVERSEALFKKINQIQSLIDSGSQMYNFARELVNATHQIQVDNGMKVLQYRLEELQSSSKPIFQLPASIAYQQLLGEWNELLSLNGPYHQNLSLGVELHQGLEELGRQIQEQLNKQHSDIAILVSNASELFVSTQKETTQLIQHGHRVLLALFGISISMSLLLTYYFVNRRIVARLTNLSNSLDAIINNDLSHPIEVDGKDEIGNLSAQLIQYGQKVEEMERTNALSLINNTQASLITCNLQGQIESANPSAQASLQLESGKVKKTLWRCFPEHLQPRLEALFNPENQLIKKGADSVTLSLGNENKPYYLRLYLRKFNQGLHDKVIVTITDVTDQEHANRLLEERVREKTQSLLENNEQLQAEIEERQRAEAYLKQTQNDLIQAAKMAVVGQTMTSLAHELNQPLSAMSTYLYTARLALEQAETGQITQSLSQIENLTERMGKIVNSLRHFARKTSSDEPMKSLSLNSVVEQAILLVQTKAKRQQVELHNELPETLFVIGETLSLEQILINLLVNACEAASSHPHKSVSLVLLSSDDKVHRIAIIDSGSGFEHGVVGKLFTPFTTTKEVGLGLGLNICQSLIERMNGQIYLASNLDKGAMVVLELLHE
ncbi:HAMP domain-containing protein [Vibrio sp. Y2-5]|uniref:ATP-binding protein n=1 Tax=Vibrio sp. Y2-5 TaxID=2743977 RepID=UPI001660C03E|nr:ATP-binding protein [Vibrio sp. Y2-5]MBD0784863.1 HAMP domain-containing protein [Vibrio sp. Y2-5]